MPVEGELSGEGTSMEISLVPSPPPNEPNPLHIESWCNTQVEVMNFNYMWTISNFTFCPQQTGEVLASSQFSPEADDKMAWRLHIYPNGLDPESSEYVSLYIKLEECDQPYVVAKFKFTLLNGKNMDNRTFDSYKTFRFVPMKDWGFRKFVKQDLLFDEASGWLTNDTLSILCEVSVAVHCISISGRNRSDGPVIFRVPECSFPEDLGSLLETQCFCDVKLCVSDKEFYAHKAILAARSPVFATMFLQRTEEDGLNSITLTDINEEVLQELLRFIYTGTANNLERMAHDLLAAADKYSLDRLKIICERALYSNLKIENACNVLVTAYSHCSDQLRAITMNFIIANAFDVMETEGWRSMVTFYPHLVSEAFKAMAFHNISPVDPPMKRLKPISYIPDSTA